MTQGIVVVAVALSATIVTLVDAAPRSRSVRAEFVRLNACPSTSEHRLPCPGFQIDHREALVCGGRDELGNLQWLTLEEHKAKTRVEVKLCRGRR